MCEVDLTRKCRACFEEKPMEGFYFKKDRQSYGHTCKKCIISGKKQKEQDKKLCRHCGVAKPLSDFQKAGGGKWLQPYCKPCDAKRKRNYVQENLDKEKKKRKEYYVENKVIISEKTKERYIKNIEKIKVKSKEYRNRTAEQKRKKDREYGRINREKISKQLKAKRQSNPEYYKAQAKAIRQNRTPEQRKRLAEWQKEYRIKNRDRLLKHRELKRDVIREQNRIRSNKKSATDICYRIVKNLRSRTRFALKKWDTVKSDTTERLLGCTIPEFKKYFSSLFTEGMTWELFMLGEIHIDHIKPCSKFDLRISEQQRECFHYTNLQPLWQLDNLRKGTFYNEEIKKYA